MWYLWPITLNTFRRSRAQDGDKKEWPLNLLLVCFHTEHTLCIIKGRLNQAINTHCSSFAGLCHHGNMCVFLSQPDTAGDCDVCEIWRREQSRIKTSHYFLCVPPRAPERTGGKSLALLILILILTANDSLFSNPLVPVWWWSCVGVADTICSLTEPWACMDSPVFDAPLPKHSGILPIIPLLLSH